MESLQSRLSKFYSLSQEDYERICAEPSFSAIPTLENDAMAIKAKERVARAIENKEKVVVYGDYDTDGIMATSIIVRSFRTLGKTCYFHIPSRYVEGYGINMENAKKIVANGFKLVILVDNGIGAVEEISYLVSKGIDVIVIDHHAIGDSLPPGHAIIHPVTCDYGRYAVSAGYLSFLFSILLLDRVDDYLLTLAGLSTLSDLMPMKEYNHTLVALALENIAKYHYKEIMLLAGASHIDENVLSMVVIPAINSIGRISEDNSISKTVHYFADFNGEKEKLANWMLSVNQQRKLATSSALDLIKPDFDKAAIVVIGNLKEGLNGLLANRLLSQYKKPAAVFSPSTSEPDCYVGSLRAPNGVDITLFQKEIAPILVHGGGHPGAGGVSIKKSDYGAFKEAFELFAYKHPYIPERVDPIPLSLAEINKATYAEIRRLAPFGKDFPEPIFRIEDVPYARLVFFKNDTMAKIPLPEGEFVSFSYGKNEIEAAKIHISFTGKLKINEFRGKASLQFVADREE